MEEKNGEKQIQQTPWQHLLFKNRARAIILSTVLFFVLIVISIAFIGQNKKLDRNEHLAEYGNNTVGKQMMQSEWPMLWGSPDNQTKCQNIQSVKFSAIPIDIKDISYIEPIGELREGHIVPGDHAGIDYKTSPTSAPVDVFSPADGFLVGVEKHPYTPPPGYPPTKHYHIYLEHSCTLFSGFVHLTDFAQDVLAASQELRELNEDTSGQFKNIALRLPVKAGQKIGTAWTFGLLGFLTVDLTVVNKGYLNKESYKGENWRIHSVSGFDYLEEPLKTLIMAKNPRTANPLGGEIDFDIEEKLVGNWFQEGTNGFRNEKMAPKQCGNFPCPYWEGHIAFVYDYIDPNQLRVSVGYNSGLSSKTPFGIKGNAPDFKDVGIEDGLVKYELVPLKDIGKEKGYESQSSLITVTDENMVLGTLLAQVIDANSIKVEIFPLKTKEQIADFTSNARIYHR